MKILIADDSPDNRALLRKMLLRMAHEVIEAENGEQAVILNAEHSPDLILMDVLMPIMNGLQAIEEIRRQSMDKWVPIFVLSAISSTEVIVEGLNAGADDYLPKPLHQSVLTAKIASVQRSIEMQQKILDDAEQLKRYHQQNEQEQLFLQNIFSRLIGQSDLKDPCLKFWLKPAQRFSGDLLCARRANPDQLYFMQADATGHGLAAAVPNVLVNQIFHGMSKKGLPIALMAREINRVLHTQLPLGRFVALAVGKIDCQQRSIELWNGGLPDAWVLSDSGQLLHTFKSRHTFSGILSDQEFDDSTEIWHWRQPCKLLLYSDGIIDAGNPAGEAFGNERLLALLLRAPVEHCIAAIETALETHLQGTPNQDDMSCLSLSCP